MASNVAIPGRRISDGEVFYTDWIPRGGDCIILRVEVLASTNATTTSMITVGLETQGEDGTTVTAMTPTYPSGGLELTEIDIGTCLFLATTSATAGNGAQEKVRVVLTANNNIGDGGYLVVRIFPPIFFDSARAY